MTLLHTFSELVRFTFPTSSIDLEIVRITHVRICMFLQMYKLCKNSHTQIEEWRVLTALVSSDLHSHLHMRWWGGVEHQLGEYYIGEALHLEPRMCLSGSFGCMVILRLMTQKDTTLGTCTSPTKGVVTWMTDTMGAQRYKGTHKGVQCHKAPWYLYAHAICFIPTSVS